MNAPKIKQIHEEIPTISAWQQGRRIYVKCAYGSDLNTKIRAIGGKWDREVRALWVGSTKKDKVVEAVMPTQRKKNHVEDVKSRGHWVAIPYGATQIRDHAKNQLGGVWGAPEHKLWAMPTAAAAAEVNQMVTYWYHAKKKKEEERRLQEWKQQQEREQQARKRRAEEAEQRRKASKERGQRILDNSGRTPTGDTETLIDYSTRYMNKATAMQETRTLGSIVRFRDGRRGVVVEASVRFVDSDAASSLCFHRDADVFDVAHWDLIHEVAVVEPTEEELAEDAAKEAKLKEAADVHRLMDSLNFKARSEPVTEPEGAEVEATITETFGGYASSNRGGILTLTREGVLYYYHGGYYDSYISTYCMEDDPEMVEEARRIVGAGSRRVVYRDQIEYRYQIEAMG